MRLRQVLVFLTLWLLWSVSETALSSDLYVGAGLRGGGMQSMNADSPLRPSHWEQDMRRGTKDSLTIGDAQFHITGRNKHGWSLGVQLDAVVLHSEIDRKQNDNQLERDLEHDLYWHASLIGIRGGYQYRYLGAWLTASAGPMYREATPAAEDRPKDKRSATMWGSEAGVSLALYKSEQLTVDLIGSVQWLASNQADPEFQNRRLFAEQIGLAMTLALDDSSQGGGDALISSGENNFFCVDCVGNMHTGRALDGLGTVIELSARIAEVVARSAFQALSRH